MTENKKKMPSLLFEKRCKAVMNYRVEVGTIGTTDGISLSSDISIMDGCNYRDKQCQRKDSTIIWKPDEGIDVCGLENIGKYNSIYNKEYILVEEIQLLDQVSDDIQEKIQKCNIFNPHAI